MSVTLQFPVWHCVQHGPLPLPAAAGRAAASMRTESPSWSSWRHDGALPLAGQQTSRASGPATRARDEHACCGSIPRFSVRAQEAGPRRSAVKFQCGLQPDFPGLSISHVMASCMQRAVCCCAEHQLRPLDRRVRLQPCSAASARLVFGKDSVPYGTRMCTMCSACICACACRT